ncbi:peptidyl-prolyl cis-trans isomerase [Clostridium sp. DJ247]|uniref:peptidyl-prolyl cis-trans isomerase n=1 Tax=Clostridium sp. DJ247 TaxID=2726188 RepID=UPI00162AC55F|nr:peptidyl-prolyl cis-trans isomerase [Clostridium sp. DJ247]MBC2582968.1 peptidylprolyl isomerase [Clostridium sp. DJ247]
MEDKILAIVNGQKITERDLEATIARFPRERQSYLKTENGKKQLLDEIISFELIYNYAKDSGIENSEEYINQLEAVKKEILTQTAISNIMSQVVVTDKEVEDYYNANKEMFVEPEMVTAKHILVQTEEKAKDILDEIKGGMSFEKAAQEYSSCPSKAQEGNLGKFGRGQMVPEFEAAAFSLAEGVISEPVKTQFGYHLVKVEEKHESSSKPFEEVKDMIKNNLLQERQAFKYSEVNNELRNKYSVEIINQ